MPYKCKDKKVKAFSLVSIAVVLTVISLVTAAYLSLNKIVNKTQDTASN
tara:strand:+ start:1600 stop:1746 length:147 start_codon:yes stop_codon:yes gene_type:complete